MYKISVTTIEKFRRFMDEVSARDNEEELQQSIKGIFKGNDMTRVGQAYHQIIEQEAVIVEGGLVAEADGVKIFFTDEQALPAVEFKRNHRTMIHEVSVTKVYQTLFGPILVKGKLDALEGAWAQDTKCKFGPIRLEEYIDSYQWRFYEDMIGIDVLHYDFFEFEGFRELQGDQPYLLDGVTIGDPIRLECLRYPRLELDCQRMLQEFLNYIEARDLWPFLKTVPDAITVAS